MKQAILDTNFILTCAKQKIDFFEELKLLGINPVVPKQVIREIEGIKKPEAELALKILDKNNFDKIDFGKGHVDDKIVNYLKDNKEILLATLDSALKNRVTNPKIVIRGKKRLEII